MEIVVASGKGGTGKTFVASNLAYYLSKRGISVVAVDADVEAPDLLAVLGGCREEIFKEVFFGSSVPAIDYGVCYKCWRCVEACEFDALSMGGEGPIVDYERCEGLGTCAVVCPTKAITLMEERTGTIYGAVSETGIPVVTGDLDLGRGNSGRLVYELKSRAYDLSLDASTIVVDAAPGIGCPVISSIAGSDLLLMVVEPTPQSVKGGLRLLKVVEALNVEPLAVVNRWDLNPRFSKNIPEHLGVEVLGFIPYDEDVVKAYMTASPLLAYSPKGEAAISLEAVFESLLERMG